MSRTKRVVIVGSWAKEQITVENLRRTGRARVYCYLDTPNPGILPRVDGFRLGSLKDAPAIVDFAREVGAELALMTSASPLAAGTADVLEAAGVRAFGPRRAAARLESDK